MNEGVQIIVSPAGERLAVLPEADYLLLLAASEDDDGEARPNFWLKFGGVASRSPLRGSMTSNRLLPLAKVNQAMRASSHGLKVKLA